jgi:hypothetical protein
VRAVGNHAKRAAAHHNWVMHAYVRFEPADGTQATLSPGDLIGRAVSAALVLDDARISEAHAFVSLRGAELKLLSLRGSLAVAGETRPSITLSPGQRITFARGVEALVREVALPESLVALQGDGLPSIVLHGNASLIAGPAPRLLPRHDPEADAHLWSVGERWRLAVRGEASRDVGVGDSFTVGTQAFRLVFLKVERAGVAATAGVAPGGTLRLVTDFDTAQIHRMGHPPVLVGGSRAGSCASPRRRAPRSPGRASPGRSGPPTTTATRCVAASTWRSLD